MKLSIQYYDLLCWPSSDFVNCPNNIPYRKRNSQVTHSICLSCFFSLYSSQTVPQTSVCFNTLACNFAECTSIWICLMFPRESGLWQVSHKRDLMLSMCSVKRHKRWSISVPVNFGRMVKVVFARCVLYNGTTFPFVTHKVFCGKIIWGYVYICYYTHFQPCFTIHWWLFPE